MAKDPEPNTDGVPFSDCVLLSESGRKFPSSKAALALKSSVFKDLLTACKPPADASGSGNNPEVPLMDHTDQEVELMWRQVHGLDPILGYVVFNDTPELDPNVLQRARDAIALTEIAHKFNVTGRATVFLYILCAIFKKCSPYICWIQTTVVGWLII